MRTIQLTVRLPDGERQNMEVSETERAGDLVARLVAELKLPLSGLWGGIAYYLADENGFTLRPGEQLGFRFRQGGELFLHEDVDCPGC